MDKVFLYDTTLRDGTQAEEINFTVNNKIRIAQKLIDFGIDYIEGGWPGSNPRDIEFFNKLKDHGIPLEHITAFSSTRRNKTTCENDPIIQKLLEVNIPNLTIFGKTWDLHVTDALNITLEENLELIYDTISYLKKRVDKVFYDAEHFFDGYKANPEYAIKTLMTAFDAGAESVILCETNGGTLPMDIYNICLDVKKHTGEKSFGIHAHNDCECAVANSIMAVQAGARQVQGTMNGIGERCGNANLCSIIPSLQIKYGYDCVSSDKLQMLREMSLFVNEIANITPNSKQPYVGRSAFAHKGGIHVSAIMKNASTYEHIKPELVGNKQRILLSDLSGKSNLLYKTKEFGIVINDKDPKISILLRELKDMENKGYEYEAAEASFELMVLSILEKLPEFFEVKGFRVINDNDAETEATVTIVVNGQMEHTAAYGNGPVNALDNALSKALIKFYPSIAGVSLVDFKVRILDGSAGTEAQTRVLMEFIDEKGTSWTTVGVDEDIVDASYKALVDAVQYKLYKDGVTQGEDF